MTNDPTTPTPASSDEGGGDETIEDLGIGDAWDNHAWAEDLADCPPPRRWPADSVEDPMFPIQQAHHDQLVAAAGIAPWKLPEDIRLVLRWVAAGDNIVADALSDLLERVRDEGFTEGSNLTSVPLYGPDESIAVTVTVAELARHGLPDDATGVAWADRNECAHHAINAARDRPAQDRNYRGVVLYDDSTIDCDTCRHSDG